jgi:CubicO group peptidase (beta-lactamase class C family)
MKIGALRVYALVAMAALSLLTRGSRIVAEAQEPIKPAVQRPGEKVADFVDWATATPESQGMSGARLEALWQELQAHHTTGFLVIRNDAVVFERYTSGWNRTTKHGTASLAKALVGGVSLMTAMTDRRIAPDDLASRYVPQWRADPRKRAITVRQLATHTSGIEDAEADDLPHAQLTGWKGEFWQSLAPPRDPFTLARDAAPVLDKPGKQERYSNPGMAMLSYCITASLRGAPDADLRSLLRHRIMQPIGAPDAEWSCGYDKTVMVDGLPLVADWGGGAYSPNAAARVGRLMMKQGAWNGKQLLDPTVVQAATTNARVPNSSGLGWWVNCAADGGKRWPTAPTDAFSGAGAGHQFLLVVPSLNLIVVRNGAQLDPKADFNAALDDLIVRPLMLAFTAPVLPPYPPSPVIRKLTFAPVDTIIRQASDSDCWPMTWGDDDNLYTAYGDGYGFDPKVPQKLSLGLACVRGTPVRFRGVNIRSATGEQIGNGPRGKKASGILMVDGTLYLWARNAGNSQLAWSSDHGKTWTWADWTFSASFGCPTFLNFGRNYAGARDDYVYIYSPDSATAYHAADHMALARAPRQRLRERAAYEFFVGLDAQGAPLWSSDIERRGPVFTHPGRCLRSQIVYDAGIKRYLWWQQLPGTGKDEADTRFAGGMGIYDAPEPWGPWTTVYFTNRWDVGPGESASFPTRWISRDGKTLALVFSGDDSFSVRRATLLLNRPRSGR